MGQHNLKRNGYTDVSTVGNKGDLINVEPLKKMVECALISPYIKNEKPLSLLIVAKAESGKTSIMKAYRQNKGLVYVSDCTAYGLTRDILPKMVCVIYINISELSSKNYLTGIAVIFNSSL